MPEMPIEQNYGRYIDPMEDEEDMEEGLEVEIPADQAELEELPDGRVRVTMDNLKGPEESPDFYENLALKIDTVKLQALALRYIGLIDKDKQAREDRDKQYEEGLKRTGMGKDAPVAQLSWVQARLFTRPWLKPVWILQAVRSKSFSRLMAQSKPRS